MEERDTVKVFRFARDHLGETFESPRRLLRSVRRPQQSFRIVKVDDDKIVLEFSAKGRRLYLGKWRFEEALRFLDRSSGAIRVGASLDSSDTSSLEGRLQSCERERSSKNTATKTAPHIGDILALCGITQYMDIERNGRIVQGIRLR